MRRSSVRLVVALLLVLVTPLVSHPGPAGSDEGDQHSDNMSLLFNAPNSTGATNSDLTFWGDRAYAGNYSGFRIFDVSDPEHPEQLVDFPCYGPQSDTAVWENQLLFVTVDTTLTGPECGSPAAPTSDDPTGWEGVRIFDVSDPTDPQYIDAVYTDCGAHTITLYPQSRREVMIYVSSYPLLPGPTCGPIRGPENGNSPLHEKISVISVPVDAPEDAEVVAEPTVSYPGDPDNRWDPAEHGLVGNFNPFTACHDITVHEALGLAAAACAEQVQLWSIDEDGIPETEEPLWVFDDNVDEDGPGGGDVARDFWHTTRFTWDGRYVQVDDESMGSGCPTVTPGIGDTGRTHLLSVRTGRELSTFTLDPARALDDTYCSVHQGNFVRTRDGRYLSVSAWYQGGVNVIDFTDPRNPREVAYYDAGPAEPAEPVDPAVAAGPQGEIASELAGAGGSVGLAHHPDPGPGAGPTGSNNWTAYWYEGPRLPGRSLTIYGQDGFAAQPEASRGFQVYRVDLPVRERRLDHLNPQTQD